MEIAVIGNAEGADGLDLILGVASRAVSPMVIPVLPVPTWVRPVNGRLFPGTAIGWQFPPFWAILLGSIADPGSGAYALEPPVPALATA